MLTQHLVRGIFLFLLASAATSAQSHQFHPPEPGVNLGDTSFLDGVAGPGWMVQQIVDASRSTQIADSLGRTTAVPANNAIIGLTHVAWFSQRQILRAWFGPEVLLLPGYVHAGSQGSTAGFGDLIVSP